MNSMKTLKNFKASSNLNSVSFNCDELELPEM